MFFKRFFQRYLYLSVFISLQCFAWAVFSFTKKEGLSKFISIHNVLSNSVYSIEKYLDLQEKNTALLIENERLKNQIDTVLKKRDTAYNLPKLSNFKAYTVAKIIANNYKNRNNLIVIDKGALHGVQKDIGVVTSAGIVGVVLRVEENYSVVLSVLNTINKVSVSVKGMPHFGSLYWNGSDYHHMNVEDLEAQATVSLGDTIVTNINSYEFPEGVPVGRVTAIDMLSADVQELRIQLFNDMSGLHYVYVFNQSPKKEIKKILDNVEYF